MQRGRSRGLWCTDHLSCLADEPTGNLDSFSAERVMETLQKISSSALTTMVVVTHSDDVSRSPPAASKCGMGGSSRTARHELQ